MARFSRLPCRRSHQTSDCRPKEGEVRTPGARNRFCQRGREQERDANAATVVILGLVILWDPSGVLLSSSRKFIMGPLGLFLGWSTALIATTIPREDPRREKKRMKFAAGDGKERHFRPAPFGHLSLPGRSSSPCSRPHPDPPSPAPSPPC